MDKTRKSKEFRIYRANKNFTGTASAWQLSFKEDNKYDPYILFLVMAPQSPENNENGDAQFLWKEKGITVKLGDADLGKILAMLEGRTKDAKLFHESPSGGNKIVEFKPSLKKGTDDEYEGYFLSVSFKGKEDKSALRLYQSINDEEASILTNLLRKAIGTIYNW